MNGSQARFKSSVNLSPGRMFPKGLLMFMVFMLSISCNIMSCQNSETIEEITESLSRLNSEENGTLTSGESDAVVSFENLTVKPSLIHKVEPRYPEKARKAGIEGMVVLKVLVDTSGNIETTEIVKSIPQLDEAAVEAASQFKFKPGQVDQKAVRTWMTIPFNFRLKLKK